MTVFLNGHFNIVQVVGSVAQSNYLNLDVSKYHHDCTSVKVHPNPQG